MNDQSENLAFLCVEYHLLSPLLVGYTNSDKDAPHSKIN
jgi:hypothetical protein